MSQQINLFNPVFLRPKKFFSALTMVQVLALILAGSIILSVYARYRVGILAADAARVSAQLLDVKTQLALVNAQYAADDKTKLIEQEIQRKENELKSLQRVFDVLDNGELGNTQGYAQYFRSFSRQMVDGLWLTGFSIHGAGNNIGVQGRALQAELVPLYITQLKSEATMQGKSFATLNMQVVPPAVAPAGTAATSATNTRQPTVLIDFSLQSSGMALKAVQAEVAK